MTVMKDLKQKIELRSTKCGSPYTYNNINE